MKVFFSKFKRLTKPEQTILVSLLLSLSFTFCPWFYKVKINPLADKNGNYEIIESFHAYNSDIIAVLGYFYAIFILTAITAIIVSMYDKFINSLIKKYNWFFLFCTSQSFFLLILTFLIYTSYSMQFARADTKYSLFITMLFNIVALFASHFYFINQRKLSMKREFASKMKGAVHLETEEVSNNKTIESEEIDNEEKLKQMTFADYDLDK